MTDFLIRGTTQDVDKTIEDINDELLGIIDWKALKRAGFVLEDATLNVESDPPKVWTLPAAPGVTEVIAQRCTQGFVFVEVYDATTDTPRSGQEVFNAVVEQHHTNGGDLVITLAAHDDPWLVRVVKP